MSDHIEARPADDRTGPELADGQVTSSSASYAEHGVACSNELLYASGKMLDPHGADRHRHCATCCRCLPGTRLSDPGCPPPCTRCSIAESERLRAEAAQHEHLAVLWHQQNPNVDREPEGFELLWLQHHPPRRPRPGQGFGEAGTRSVGHVARRLEGLLRTVNEAVVGSRNATLHWATCRVAEMVADGELADPAAAVDALALVGERTGLAASEVAGTIRSGLNTSGVSPS